MYQALCCVLGKMSKTTCQTSKCLLFSGENRTWKLLITFSVYCVWAEI